MQWVYILIISFFLPRAAAFASVYEVKSLQLDELNLASSVEIFLDKTRKLSLQEVSQEQFVPLPNAMHSVGIFNGYVWLRLQMKQSHVEHQTILIDLKQQARKIDLFVRSEGETNFLESSTGYFQKDNAPFQLLSRGSTWELSLDRNKVLDIYVRIDADQAYTVHLRAFDLKTFYLRERGTLYFAGLYFGIMLVLVVFNLVQFFQSRELSYVYYVVTLLTLHIPVMGATLYGTEFLGFRFTFADGYHLILLKMLGVTFMTLFARSMLVVPQNIWLNRGYLALLALYTPFLIGWFFVRPLASWHATSNNLVLLIMVYTLIAVGYRIRQGYRPAVIFGISILPICLVSIGAILLQVIKLPHLMPNLGIIFPSTLVFQVVALSFAIIDKVRVLQLQKEREAALYQKEILQLNSSLEKKVDEQTREIRSMLEHTHLGLLSVGPGLVVHKDYSKHLEHLLETKEIGGGKLWDILFNKVDATNDMLMMYRCALEYSIGEEEMFFEANAAILPKQIKVRSENFVKIFDCDWSAIVAQNGLVERVLLGLSDVTEKIQWEKKAHEDQLRLQSLAEILARGTVAFYRIEEELKSICRELSSTGEVKKSSLNAVYIRLHTLKSRARLEKFNGLTSIIHDLEEHLVSKIADEKLDPVAMKESLNQVGFVLDLYHQALASIETFKQDSILQEQYQLDLYSLISQFGEKLTSLCQELEKAPCRLEVSVPKDLSLTPSVHEAVYEALLHIVRNTADHGLESLEERQKCGKHLDACLSVALRGVSELVLTDDGRGLALAKIEDKARSLGLVFESREELANVIFTSGFSTKESSDHISGRGVGMDAVRSILRSVGGDAWIELRGPTTATGYAPFATVLVIPTN